MKISIFNSFKIFTQNLDPDKDQIWHCLIMTPIYLYIVTLFIFLSSLIIHKDFSFEILLNTPVGLLFIAAIYYILVFIPAYFLQLFLLKFNFLNFVSILVSAIFLTFLIPNILAILFMDPWQILPIEIICMVSLFSLTFAITYWILLLKTLKKAAKPSNLKFPN
ncbi:hypothetical protein BVD86_16920 [Acinetobacter pittii]|nr:hypothetical protein BVD86_16920 [Acinetobacter pittii]